MSIDAMIMGHVEKAVLVKCKEIEQAERKRVIEQVRKWAKDYCRNNGDYSAVGAINDLREECLDKLERGEE